MKNRKNKEIIFVVMLLLAISMVILAMIAPILAPNDPLDTNFSQILQKPSSEYLFGTDQVGRCIYSRVLYGARVSLGITFLLLSIIFILGLMLGTVAGMAGGTIDTIIMRIADTVLSFPDIVFAIAIVGILGPGMRNTILALSVIWWTKYARLTRVLVMTVKNKEYIHAATMAGAGKVKLITHYIFPNIISPLVVQLALDVGGMMLAIAGLSFLGLGVQPPIPEWGNMLNEGRFYLQTAPWLLIYPGAAIFIVVAVFNILGDSVRDLLDPKHL
ncbi:ABC-type dipeptide/oligopeptide/nickel transport system, permease component [Clostridium aceticum]|uniref:ABC-type dipeptide/oligopeptide/nickel transport system, permease component n=1 Tax=Clostridium aceticum TaxID=84022 RepID=A0A0D8IA83_9CLOT|nr:nickel transporter permease [Clostridium aceticum]AKL96342.1 ABC-type dipeptide/oligopeptide/nickel transport system, permease component [Clostridium aceticum]KJF26932.1 nickel transporter permease NikC [Clostridium aceticum]